MDPDLQKMVDNLSPEEIDDLLKEFLDSNDRSELNNELGLEEIEGELWTGPKTLLTTNTSEYIASKAQFAPSSVPAMARDALTNFLCWLEQSGAYLYGIELRLCDDGSGYGIFATQNLRLNEIIIKIPRPLMLSAFTIVRHHPDVKAALEKHPGQLTCFESLVFYFCQPPTNHWRPYNDVLPKSYTTPAFTGADLNGSEMPPMARQLWDNQKAEIQQMYEKFQHISDTPIDYRRFLWAWNTVNTRCIYVENPECDLVDNTGGDTVAVIPFVDMLNHNSPAQAQTMYDKFSGCYTVMVGTAVSIGQQIFVCYGGHDNAKLYIEYGFTLPDNVHNKVSLSTEEVIQLADELKITIGDAQRTAAIQAAQPCTLYASDQAPSWGLIVTVNMEKFRQGWKEIAFGDRDDEDEPETVEAVDRILRRLKEQIQLRIDGSPEAVRWLWEEQNAVVLGCCNRSS